MGYRNPLTVLGRGLVIVGAVFKTAYSGARWEIGSTPTDSIIGYSGNAFETTPASIRVDTGSGAGYAELDITSGQLNGHTASTLSLRSRDAANDSGFGLAALASITTDLVEILSTQGVSLFGAGRINPVVGITPFFANGMYAGPWTDAGGTNAIGAYTVDATGWVKVQGTAFSTVATATGFAFVSGLPVPADGKAHSFTVTDFNGTPHVVSVMPTSALQLTITGLPASVPLQLDGIGYQS